MKLCFKAVTQENDKKSCEIGQIISYRLLTMAASTFARWGHPRGVSKKRMVSGQTLSSSNTFSTFLTQVF